MKNYLDLVSISAKKNRRKNTMTIICIVLAVFLVSSIFGMAEMEIKSQKIQIVKDEGNWHYAFNVDKSDSEMISLRPDVKSSGLYSQMLENQGYLIGDKKVSVIGMDGEPFENIFDVKIVEGKYPENDDEILISDNAKVDLKKSVGDSVILSSPSGADNFYGACLTSNSFAKNITEGIKQSKFLVQFSPYSNMKKNLSEIKDSYNLSDSQVEGNTKLLGILGQSDNNYALQLYTVAFVLFVLVMLAGIIMITNSLNTNVIQRTEFFGLMRCLGATDKQVMKFVRKEALSWCKIGIPIGISLSIVIIWVLCAILRFASPHYFSEMPIFGISIPGTVAGIIVGLLTVLLAAQSPAKKASKVSPLMAISGNANNIKAVKKAANTKLFNVETALGIEHAKSNKKNFILMVSSFSLSIILFMSFSATIDFMNHAVKPVNKNAQDISLVSVDDKPNIQRSVVSEIKRVPGVKYVYGRMNAVIPAEVNGVIKDVLLVSYEENQFNWGKKFILDGSMEEVVSGNEFLVVNFGSDFLENGQEYLTAGDKIKINGQREFKIAGQLSSEYMRIMTDKETLICSEKTFKEITGQDNYNIVDIKVDRNISDESIKTISNLVNRDEVDFSDYRTGNSEVKGAYYSMLFFIYGFVAVIALIAIFNINNSISMSVSARTRQYGFMRAIGMGDKQLVKMVLAETLTYSIIGSVVGMAIGLYFNKLIFENMVTSHWGAQWTVPVFEMVIILLIVLLSSVEAVYNPTKRIKKMSIVETIRAE